MTAVNTTDPCPDCGAEWGTTTSDHHHPHSSTHTRIHADGCPAAAAITEPENPT